jgi:hypothetical protein
MGGFLAWQRDRTSGFEPVIAASVPGEKTSLNQALADLQGVRMQTVAAAIGGFATKARRFGCVPLVIGLPTPLRARHKR